ncbi:hypothetical protein TcG_12176, partial [Trypanosoma cruzi]
MRSRCAATFATFSQSSSSASSTSLTIAGMPLPRNTHSTTMSCRLSSTIMNATPNNYWRTCSTHRNHTVDQVGRHALHLSVLVVLGAHLHILSIHGLGAARGCRQEQLGWKKQMCGNNGHPHSLTSPLTLLSHIKGRCYGEEKSAAQRTHKRIRSSNAIHVAMQQRALRTYTQTAAKRGTWHIQIHGAVLYFSLLQRIGIASHTHSEARRTPAAPFRVHPAGRVQSPKCHR